MTRSSSSTPRVAVIGAGFGGIAAAVMLRRRGLHDFVILEKSLGVGGTWWHNRYPGAEVDTPSVIYSLSFSRHPWTRTHARQPELQKYLEQVVDDQQLRDRFRFDVEVVSAGWDDSTSTWTLGYGDGSSEVFDAVISAVGFLNDPSIPAWATAPGFAGRIFHSTHWPDGLDVTDKSVAVIGTGSTAVQIVGELAGHADRLTVFQRQPNWMLPKADRDLSAEEQERSITRWRYRLRRTRGFINSERGRVGGKANTEGTRANRAAHQRALAHLHSTLSTRPDLIELLRPTYAFGAKRPVINDTFYPALLQDSVHLVPHAVESLVADGLVDTLGETHPVDVVVLATGFKAADYLGRIPVSGVGGRSLAEEWAGEPQALGGITVPGFPNFFMLYGPNTNAGPVPFFLEAQADFAARALRRAWSRGHRVVDTRSGWMVRYNTWLQKRLAKTVWGSTTSYFTSASGRVVTQWPTGATQYWLVVRFLRRVALRSKSG